MFPSVELCTNYTHFGWIGYWLITDQWPKLLLVTTGKTHFGVEWSDQSLTCGRGVTNLETGERPRIKPHFTHTQKNIKQGYFLLIKNKIWDVKICVLCLLYCLFFPKYSIVGRFFVIFIINKMIIIICFCFQAQNCAIRAVFLSFFIHPSDV